VASKLFKGLPVSVRSRILNHVLETVQPSTITKTLMQLDTLQNSLQGRTSLPNIIESTGDALVDTANLDPYQTVVLSVVGKVKEVCANRFSEVFLEDREFQGWLSDGVGAGMGSGTAAETVLKYLLADLDESSVLDRLKTLDRLMAYIEECKEKRKKTVEVFAMSTAAGGLENSVEVVGQLRDRCVQFIAKRWMNMAIDGALNGLSSALLKSVAEGMCISVKREKA
jgi:hypothetical protein